MIKNLKKTAFKLALAVTFIFIPLSLSANAAPAPESFSGLVDKLSPAVVNISTTQVVKGYDNQVQTPAFPPGSGFEGFNEYLSKQYKKKLKVQKATSLGSGFIIDASGIVVTNNHVISGGTDITVTMHDNTEYKAKIIGRDPKVDIAVLKIDAGKKLPFVQFGDSDNVKVGDWVLAIGNPYGLGGSVSAGIISARARDINVGPFDDFLQTDAAINRGNSGGPMFDINGKVIGVNTAIFSPTGTNVGIGFAMPSALVEPVIKQIIQYGKSRRAWLGVKIQTITKDIAESLGMKEPKGALVLDVTPNGPADNGGLKVGDVITAINGKPIDNMRKLPKIVTNNKIGDKISVEYLRNGKVINGSVRLGELDSDEDIEQEQEATQAQKPVAPKAEVKRLAGIEVLEITPEIATRNKLPVQSGLVITNINPNGKAAEEGIVEGSIIIKVNNQPVSKIAELEAAIKAAKKQGRASVLLLVMAGNDSRFIALPID